MRKVKLSDRTSLPDKPGIYWAVCNRKVLYIGMAGKQGLRSRWTDNGGWGKHFKLTPLMNYEDDHNSIVFLQYRTRPLWRVAHDEAVAIDEFFRRQKRLPMFNRKREDRVWWIDLLDTIEAFTIGIGAAIVAMYFVWR